MNVQRKNKNTLTVNLFAKSLSFPIILECFYFLFPSTLLYNHYSCLQVGDLLMILLSLKDRDNKVTGENKN